MSANGDDERVIRPLDAAEWDDVWGIDRSERVEHLVRHRDGALVREPHPQDVPGWPDGEPEHYAPLLRDCRDHGGSAWGAFADERLVGAAVLEARFIGRVHDRLQLKFLHVSRSERGTGLGRALFDIAADHARGAGARGLYVSATPTGNTIDFYLRLGCRVADDVDPDLFALEPEDIHLVCDLAR